MASFPPASVVDRWPHTPFPVTCTTASAAHHGGDRRAGGAGFPGFLDDDIEDLFEVKAAFRGCADGAEI